MHVSFLPSNSEPALEAPIRGCAKGGKENPLGPQNPLSRLAPGRGRSRLSRLLFFADQFFLRRVKLALDIPQLRLEGFDVFNRELDRARFAVTLLCRVPCHDDARGPGRSVARSAVLLAGHAAASVARRPRLRE